MKTKHYILYFILYVSCFFSLQAQVSEYELSNCYVPVQNQGGIPTPYRSKKIDSLRRYQNTLFMSNLLSSTGDSLTGSGIPIGFPFKFDGQYYDRFAISTNYFIKLGKSSEGNFTIINEQSKGSVFQNEKNDSRRNTISTFERTLSEDSLQVSNTIITYNCGTPGNRFLQIEWEGDRIFFTYNPSRTVYLRLYEKTGQILITYTMDSLKYASRTGIFPNFTLYPGCLPLTQASVGLRGNQLNNSMENMNIMKVKKGENTWTSIERGTMPTDFCEIENQLLPPKNSVTIGGLGIRGCEYWYKWTPPTKIEKPEIPFCYFIIEDSTYLKNNGYHYKVLMEDNRGGNTYSFAFTRNESDGIHSTSLFYFFADGATSVVTNMEGLNWNKAPGVDSYDVYFGLIYPPALAASNMTDSIYRFPDKLAPNTTYYYSVVAKNSAGSSDKKIGSFTTGELPMSDCILNYPPFCSDCYDISFNTLVYNQDAWYAKTFRVPESAYTTLVKRGETYNYATKVYTERFDYPLGVTSYIYIDWNQDGDFTDANEKFSPGDITIPMDAKLGKTYLRTYWRSFMASGSDNPCGATDKFLVQQFVITIIPSETCSAFVLDYEKTTTHCYGDSTGTITLQPSGGTEPYAYAWTDGNTEQTRSELPAGTYQATVTDAAGCDQTTPLLAVQSPFLIQMDTLTINDSLMVYVSGGTGTYTYQWTKNGNSLSQSELQLPVAGTYSLTITDEALCSVTYDGIVVPENKENSLSVVKSANKILVVYPNPTMGEINVSSQHIIQKIEIVSLSGKPVYSKMNITNSNINLNISSLPSGMYLVKAYTEKGMETSEIVKK